MGSSQFRRWVGGALIWVLALVVMLAHPAFAQAQPITARGSAATTLKLAHPQRLLTEPMGRSVCLVMGGLDPGAESDKARGAADLFYTTMQALRTGDKNMTILPEEDPGVRMAWDAAAPIFASYGAVPRQVGAGDVQIMLLSDPLLEMSNTVVKRVRAAHGSKAPANVRYGGMGAAI